MRYLVLTARKPEFDEAVIPAHNAFLQSLRDADVLEQAGPFTDRSGGAYVIHAASYERACEIVAQDPLQAKSCSDVIIREWQASNLSGRDVAIRNATAAAYPALEPRGD
jgi:uncharacterized protein YciI